MAKAALIFSFIALLSTFISLASAVVIPGADTPLFYFVASSTNAAANLKPLRIRGNQYGTATLSEAGATIGKFEGYHGPVVLIDPDWNGSGSPSLYRLNIHSTLTANGCSPGGLLQFASGVFGTNKCEMNGPFYLSANIENGQLGSRLVYNWVGGYYACGSNLDVYYKVNPSEEPSDCSPINLWTVAVS